MLRGWFVLQTFSLLALMILVGCQASGGGGGTGGGIITTNPAYTTTISGTTNKVADNVDSSTITITVMEGVTPVVGNVPTFSVTGTNNFILPCSATDATGTSTCILRSTKAEVKTIVATSPNVSPTSSVTFIAGAVSTVSTISSAGPVVADGVAAMTINVTMKDAHGNVVAGSTPVFDATPATTNVYTACSASNASGASVCTMKSSIAGMKTLRITSPVAVTGSPAFFFSGPAAVANTSIVGTTPHSADGVDASVVTIVMKDATMNPVMGTVPTFSASGTGNVLGTCSSSDFTGTSTCTLKSTMAGVKALALVTPIAKAGNSVTFNAAVGAPVAANSSITGTSPVVADGVATSTVTITLKDISNIPTPGIVPTFAASDTGTTNVYGTCTATDNSGISTCTMKSTFAETKTLIIASPVVKGGGSVVFVPGAPSSLTSTINGSSPVVADGVATSTISIYIKDAYNNVIAGQTPTFSATDTGMQNVYGACSVTNTSGLSTCTLSSTIAEVKTLQLLTPVVVIGGTVTFTAGTPVAANSNITGTSPVVADGSASSTVTITLRDINNNLVSGQTPTFSATDTGTSNVYGSCSVSNTSGVSTCTLKSTTAETKTLSIATPVLKADGTVIFTPAGASVANSTITGTSPVLADGSATSTVTITLKDANNNNISGTVPTFTATDTGTTNAYGTCSATNASGISTCTLSSTKAEIKTLSIATPIVKAGGTVTFNADVPVAANSTITGTSPVVANGVATSTVTITLRDTNNNVVPGQTPTFSATDTGSTNTYGVCSATNASGISTCTLSSTVAETKTLSIATPVVKADGTVIFTAGVAVAANSTITGTSTVIADGVASSTVTITLNDVNNNPVSGQTPTFSATDTGSTNTYGSCSASDASGVSTCTLKSTTAETKTLSIATPVIKADGTVVFVPGGASVANSSISGSSPVVADGAATSTVTITLKDANNNSIIGTVPTFGATDTGSTNNYGVCSATDSSGISTCTLSSLKAESKTLSIATPIVKAGGSVVFNPGAPVAANSAIAGSSPVIADGTATSTVAITLKDANNNEVPGVTPTFSATDTGSTNNYGACSATDATGIAICTLSSLTAEIKTLSIATPVVKVGGTVTFIAGTPVAANSSISGTSPVVADGSATSTVTITLKDTNNNPVAGQIPTFGATDTSSTNNYGVCSASNASGISTCTLDSTYAEIKTLSIVTPVVKVGGTVTFTAGAAVAANSSITGTSPVLADGTATSTVTITLKDAANNSVVGQTPTFSATDTSSGNTYGSCSATNASGISTCTLSSTAAEVKTLSIATPVVKAGGTVTFNPGSPVAANSTITGTSPVVADGVATSTVTITLKDANNNSVPGQTPTFSATDTTSTNSYGSCSATNASGVSTCTLSSLVAEVKTLSIATPVVKAGGTVTFTAGAAVAANSTISGTSPVVADGVATSTVTITLKDASNNAVSGQVPTFGATDTSSTNVYGTCSSTNASGVSTCTLTSTVAEVKTLAIATPVVKAGGTVTFTAGSAVAANSTITGTSPVVADGTATSTVTITLKDASNNAVSGVVPTFGATDTSSGNTYGTCSATSASGISTCTLKSTVAEVKTLSIATPIVKAGGTVTFTAGSPVAANSTITGTSPVVADGTATSTVTITLKDASNNGVSGVVPTFGATDTSTTNVYGTCSSTNASGVSTCTLKSTIAEVKTLSIATPVVKAGATVTFTAGAPVAANSTITGTSPVVADGTAASTVTITLKDASNNAVSGVVPTFGATDTSSGNTYGTCSSTNASGVSTCTLKSTVAEVKTLSIATPVVKAGGTVTFTAGSPVAANSTITGTSPVVADGTATSTVTITLKDASNNAVSGVVPAFGATDTSTTNVYGTCSATSASGISTCTLKSTVAEVKTLSIATPVVKAGGTVTFTAGAPVAANSTITGTSPVVANGVATSTITITLKDVNNNNVSGSTPTFSATNTSSGNTYNSCSASNASGVSTCTMTSTIAEVKTLSIATPVVKAGGTVTFTAGSAVAANSTITGTSPVVADGTATSTVTITLKDASNNGVSGIVPTFGATDTSTTNVYGTCSSSDASGISTCTLKSTKAEVKTLSIATPVVKAGGTVTFTAGSAVAANSTITGTSPVVADNTATSTVTITLLDANSNPVSGQVPTFGATDTGSGNTYGTCSSSNASGVSTCTLKSTKAEVKTLSIATPVVKAGGTVTFTAGAAVAANSTITGTSPVVADNTATSTVTITLLDANSNPVSGSTPTFTTSGTGNTQTSCSATNASGVSTCTVKSTTAEVKTLAIATPVVKTGGTVTFTAGSAVAANSTITGTGPVIANNTATSTVTIVLKDATNNAVSGIVPTFGATDTGSGNTYGTCSSTDATGTSTCTLKSTKAEVKTLSIATPVVKAGGTVTFTAGSAVAANSTITGTGPVVADGTATSTVTVNLKDANSNPVSGVTPVFTSTGTGNTIGACGATNASGDATCSLKSTKAAVKTLSISSPVSKAGGTVTFTAGSPSATTTTISGTTPVSADGVSTSFISITILDAYFNPISGVTPIFNATNTNTTNVYGACQVSDSGGLSMCTLASTKAEFKTLQLTSPVAVTGSIVEFSSSLPVAANSTIIATGPNAADGATDSTVTITLRDANNNPVAGIDPTFSATDTGSGNTYDDCSTSNASGISICYMQSTVAETKTLQITSPVTKTGGTVVFTAGSAVAANSTITGTSPVVADNTATSTVTVTLKDAFNNPVSGTTPTFTTSGTGNTQTACSAGNASGVSTCTVKSTKAEVKNLSIATPVSKAGGTVTFTAGTAVAATSTITGTGPTNPDGTSVSTITITLKDVNSNNVAGVTPTFTATGTNNTYNTCSASNASGVSTCTMTSTTAETKTLSIATPFVKAGGTVVFATGSPSVANSTISATGPVVANGVATSTVTITLKDGSNAPVIGTVPTFSATGTSNTYNTCSATNGSGVSTCTMTSIKAESKTVSIATPIIKAGNSVTFTAGAASATASSIACDDVSFKADGVSECLITVSIVDANNNGIVGTTPTISVSGTSNTVTACSPTDTNGDSSCSLKSTKAEGKFLSIVTPVAKTDTVEYEFNPNGINLQVPIEMVDRGLLSTTTAGGLTFARTRTAIDPADYVGDTDDYFFEINVLNTNTSTAYPVQLVNGAGTVISDSTITVPANTTVSTRMRIQFTPSAAADTYRVKLPATAVASQIRVNSARIIIEQTGAVKTKLWIPLIGFDYSSDSSSDTGGTAATTTSTTYVVSSAQYYNWFTRTDANYDAIPTVGGWTFDAVMRASTTTGIVYAALYNKTTGNMVAEVSHTGNTAVTQRTVTFNSNATNFVNANDYELRIKTSATGTTNGLMKAGLWVKLKYLKKADVHWRLLNRKTSSTSVALPDGKFWYESATYSNPTATFMATGLSSVTATIQLLNTSTSDSATTGTVTTTLTPTATFGRVSAATTLTDNMRYMINSARTSGTATIGGAYIIINTRE